MKDQNFDINLKGMGMWPAKFNRGDGFREILVKGSKGLQNIDCEFKEVVRPGQITKLKWKARTGFFRTLQNRE